jgi:hypothetical protein
MGAWNLERLQFHSPATLQSFALASFADPRFVSTGDAGSLEVGAITRSLPCRTLVAPPPALRLCLGAPVHGVRRALQPPGMPWPGKLGARRHCTCTDSTLLATP